MKLITEEFTKYVLAGVWQHEPFIKTFDTFEQAQEKMMAIYKEELDYNYTDDREGLEDDIENGLINIDESYVFIVDFGRGLLELNIHEIELDVHNYIEKKFVFERWLLYGENAWGPIFSKHLSYECARNEMLKYFEEETYGMEEEEIEKIREQGYIILEDNYFECNYNSPVILEIYCINI